MYRPKKTGQSYFFSTTTAFIFLWSIMDQCLILKIVTNKCNTTLTHTHTHKVSLMFGFVSRFFFCQSSFSFGSLITNLESKLTTYYHQIYVMVLCHLNEFNENKIRRKSKNLFRMKLFLKSKKKSTRFKCYFSINDDVFFEISFFFSMMMQWFIDSFQRFICCSSSLLRFDPFELKITRSFLFVYCYYYYYYLYS